MKKLRYYWRKYDYEIAAGFFLGVMLGLYIINEI